MEIKAGLTGKSLTAKELKSYPVSFQLPTYVDIEVINDNKDDDEEGSSSSSSSSGGGGKQPKKSLASFSAAMEGKIPALGRIIDVVIMGKKIAVEAYAGVMGTLAKQISHSKVAVTDLLAHAGNFVTKYMPPSFMAPTGDEQKTYKYDREKNADIGFRPGPG